MDAFATAIAKFWHVQHEILLVALFSGGFFYVSRHWLKREIFGEKTMISIIVSMAFAIGNSMLAPLAYFATEHVTSFYSQFGIPSISPEFWAGWPIYVLVPMSLFLYDFVEYWNHRFMHMKWLWPIHAIHHSDPDVNGFTTYRVHILQIIFNAASFILLLSWFGMPKEVSAASGLIVTLLNAYVHLDVDWGHGPLRLVIASPRFHRWHHADTPELYGKNIANMFPIFDVLFGTYHVPGICREPMGARGVPENNFIKLMLYPFVEWGRMIAYAFTAKPNKAGSNPVVPAE